MKDLFISFDEKPLGAASLAQVHKAVLKDGRTVAVKVQHPKVRAHAAVDMATMDVRNLFFTFGYPAAVAVYVLWPFM